MSSPSRDATNRFDGLAAGYDRHRPTYPGEAIDFLIQTCGLKPGTEVADVGCGTGISTRILAARGLTVTGVEPNDEMRRQAQSIGATSGPAITYRAGRAEATGLPDEFTFFVLVAQAFHWFANESSLREFHRILKRDGWLTLLWNEQDRSDPFTDAYFRALVRHSPEPHFAARTYHDSADVLLHSTLFESQPRMTFSHSQDLDEVQLLGRAYSASFAPKELIARQQLESDLRQAFATYQRGGSVTMRYETALFLARKIG